MAWYCFLLVMLLASFEANAMLETERMRLIDQAKEMFFHAYNGYMNNAYPKDELNPLTCTGRGKDREDPNNIHLNDVLGDYGGLTLIDSLDTIAIIGTKEQFYSAVNSTIKTVSFDIDSRVQVFESNIRVLGSLLSSHLLITNPKSPLFSTTGYENQLLSMAWDLGNRLLPAFQSSNTGIPYPRVNLKTGVLPDEIAETCVAGAGTLILEFATLSRLTGDNRFEKAAKRALHAIWGRRNQEWDLIGNVIDITTGVWKHSASSVGAGADSFFEYLLKGYILFGDEEYLEMFEEAYSGIIKNVKDKTGFLYKNVNMFQPSGVVSSWVDSLSAYFSGLQVLYGDIENASKLHSFYFAIWKRYDSLPERFDFTTKSPALRHYPLRPELAESTYMLYQATKDHYYLDVGKRLLMDINNNMRTTCGFAGLSDVETKKKDDRMESFFLSETIKYLYLLFDIDHWVNKLDDNSVFTTEGHLLLLPKNLLTHTSSHQKSNKKHKKNCSTISRRDIFIRNHGRQVKEADFMASSASFNEDFLYQENHCLLESQPQGREFEVVFNYPPDYISPGFRLVRRGGEFFVNTINGVNLKLVIYGDDYTYSVSEINGLRVLRGETVKLLSFGELRSPQTVQKATSGLAILDLVYPADRKHEDPFEFETLDDTINEDSMVLRTKEYSAMISSLGAGITDTTRNFDFITFQEEPLLYGCNAYDQDLASYIANKAIMVKRGKCSFTQKVVNSQNAGASLVVIANHEETLLDMIVDANFPLEEPISIPAISISRRAAANIWGGLSSLFKKGYTDSFYTSDIAKSEPKYCQVKVKTVKDDEDDAQAPPQTWHVTFGGKPIGNIQLINDWPF